MEDFKIIKNGPHLDYMVRQTRFHHVQLSSMADLKANILLTVSSLVLTIAITQVANPLLKWGCLILMAFCFITIILAIYTVMPKTPISVKSQTKPDSKSPWFNILFFGDFLHLTYEDYKKEMEGIMNDTSMTYEVQLREIYNLGKFLAEKKYRFIRLAYLSFLCGIIISVIVISASTLFS